MDKTKEDRKQHRERCLCADCIDLHAAVSVMEGVAACRFRKRSLKSCPRKLCHISGVCFHGRMRTQAQRGGVPHGTK